MGKDKISQIYEDTIEKWNSNKGVGSIYLSKPLSNFPVILGVLERLYKKRPKANVIVVTNDFKARNELVYFLTHTECEENNIEFRKLIDDKLIRLFSVDYITKWNYRDTFDLCIFHGINICCYEMNKVYDLSRFKLICLTELVNNPNERKYLYEKAPLITNFNENQLIAINLNSPVEETQFGIPLDVNSRVAYERYTQFITQSISIFGSFEILNQVRNGNSALNISAAQIRTQIAEENGWRKDLDMTSEFDRQIDNLFNPDVLYERSIQTYEFIRKRNVLLSNYEAKLEKILEICIENKGKRILIISKRSDFASIITDYLNNRIVNTGKVNIDGEIFDTDKPFLRTYPVCMSYHNDLDKVPAYDTNTGKPILVKSGVNKGSQKMMGSEAQKKLAMRLFNEGYINILSANNACDRALNCVIDILIVTSPQCDTIRELKYRLEGVQFASMPNKVVKLYCSDTVEQSKLNSEKRNDCDTIVNKSKIGITLGENSDIIIVD